MTVADGGNQSPSHESRTATAARVGSSLRFAGSVVWALIPLLTLGMLAVLPFIHATVRLRRVSLGLLTAGYVGATVFAWATVPMDEANETTVLGNIGVGVILLIMAGGTAHAFVLRGRVFAPRTPMDPALARALAARERRQEARALVGRDPGLARELHIGRPDLPHEYDGGGLVDINHVPPGILMSYLGFSQTQAAQAVQRRTTMGGFSNTNELEVYCGLPPAFMDGLSDRVIFLT